MLIKFINETHLHALLQIIEEWARNNLIKINKGKGKSHIIQFNKTCGQKLLPTINDITPTLQYKYLGIVMQRTAKFPKEFSKTKELMKGFNKYYMLNKAHLGILTTKIIFNSYIQSKFLYHLVVFDYYTEGQ